jgi:hypothetical protein
MPGTDWKTYKELADHLGISRVYLVEVRKAAGFPAGKSLAEISAWFEAYRIGLGADGGSGEEVSGPEMVRRTRHANMLKAEEDALVKQLERRTMEGKLVSIESVCADAARCMTAVKNEFMNVGAMLRPDIAPYLRDARDAGSVEALITERHREILAAMVDRMDGITGEDGA